MQKLDKVAGKKAEVIEYNPGFVPNNKYVEILETVSYTHLDVYKRQTVI